MDAQTVPVHYVQRVLTQHELQMVLEGPEDPGQAFSRDQMSVLLGLREG